MVNNKIKIFVVVGVVFLFFCMQGFSQKDSNVYSQTNRGKFFVGGNANVRLDKIIRVTYNNNNTVDQWFGVNISPRIGYFAFKNFALGLNINYEYQNYNKKSQVVSRISAGPLVRYYLRYKNHGLFGELTFGFNKSVFKYGAIPPYSYEIFEFLSTNYSLGAGYCYFIAKNVSIELLYQYQVDKRQAMKANSQVLSFPAEQNNNQLVTVGLQYYF